MEQGRLFYVIGRSGVGKDTVLRGVRTLLGCTVAHRYITRAANDGHENHIALSEDEFLLRQQRGAFLLDWEAHGNYYGIGVEVRHWMDHGLAVFVNGSRQHLEQARQRLGAQMVSVLIDATPEICRQRLHARGRESCPEINVRMQRELIDVSRVDWVIDNSGPLPATLKAINHMWQQERQQQGVMF
ncbi:MAG: ribose 1,5-bisphosphokinase [Reinekea sp.]|nr:ribose 1,5-bisphosphokinase [Reinekea sp.]